MSGRTVLITDAGYDVLEMQCPSSFIVVPDWGRLYRLVGASGLGICLHMNVVLVRTRDMYPANLPLE